MKQFLGLLIVFAGIWAGEHAGPELLLETYLQKDYHGEFLRQNDWLTDHVLNAFMIPAWDNFIVIKKYEIQSVQIHDNTSFITVMYQQLGIVDQDSSGFKFTPVPDTVLTKFALRRNDGCWLIEKHINNPHVGLKAAKKLVPGLKTLK